ncbi:CU044_5270 family protein [Nocardia sp. NPDC049149]|uniref:CU044_5270 family protein n=1 Tax=Nocardia sp. NPDC049149 TaxID=3364315 RepID=UPI00371BE692
MINDDVRPRSKEQSDSGRAKILAEITGDPAGHAEGKARVVQLAPTRRTSRWLLIGAAAAAMVIAATAACTTSDNDQSPSRVQPRGTVAADPDLGLAAGQYLYVGTRSDGINNARGDVAYQVEATREIWVPATWSDRWMERRNHARPVKILPASADTPERQRSVDQSYFPGEWRAACGSWSYMGENVDRPECRPIEGGWHRPTPQYVAALPRDPDALLAKLKEGPGPDAKISPELDAFGDAREFLTTGLVPKDLRTTLHQALLRLPGIKVTENVPNLDGRKGTALGFVDATRFVPQGTELDEIIIDPSTEQIIGTRSTMIRNMVLGEGNQTTPAVVFETGKVMSHSAITVAVVGRVGIKPAI